jgi:hypothetical protein
MSRKKIEPGTKVKVRFSLRDRQLLVEHTFADSEYAERLQDASAGKGLIGEFTLDDLEDILGFVAAEANHTENAKLRRELDSLYDRLVRTQESYDDGQWSDGTI